MFEAHRARSVVLFCSVLFCSVLFCSVLFCSVDFELVALNHNRYPMHTSRCIVIVDSVMQSTAIIPNHQIPLLPAMSILEFGAHQMLKQKS
jgi:hypothetical protein